MRIVLIYCISIVFLFVACNTIPDSCKEQSAWQLRIGFKKVKIAGSLKTVKDSTFRSFIAQYISHPDTNVFKTPSLPLAQGSDTSKFSININKNGIHTLYVVYKRDRTFENYTCGFRTNFTLDTIYTIPKICDSIIIVQPNITDVYQENCRFYFNSDTTAQY